MQYPSRYPVYRLMGIASRPVRIGAAPEVRFKDWLEDHFQRPLHHPVSHRRYPQDSDLPIFLWYLHPPVGLWSVSPAQQFLSYPFQKSIPSLALNVLKTLPIDARRPFVRFRYPIGFFQDFLLAEMTVQPPELPVFLSLRFAVYLSPQFLQPNGSFSHSPLPHLC